MKKRYYVFAFFYILILLGAVLNKPVVIPKQRSLTNDEFIEMRLKSGNMHWDAIEANFPEYARTHTNPYPERQKSSIKYNERADYPCYYNRDAGHWEEFIEDLEMQGIDPWDPDAEDYYNLNYGN
jgi:hypothetical protein